MIGFVLNLFIFLGVNAEFRSDGIQIYCKACSENVTTSDYLINIKASLDNVRFFATFISVLSLLLNYYSQTNELVSGMKPLHLKEELSFKNLSIQLGFILILLLSLKLKF